MTKEQILELMKTDEGKNVLKEAGLLTQSEANLLALEKNQAIETKNKELLAKLAVMKDKDVNVSDEFKKTLDTLEIKDYAEAVELLYKAKNPGESEEVREYKTKMAQLTAEVNTYKGNIDNLSSVNSNAVTKLKKLLVNDEIQKTLMSEKFGLKKGQAQALSTFLTDQTTFELSEDLQSAHSKDGKTPQEFLEEWSKSEKAADFLPEKINIGGGAVGSNGSAGKTETAVDKADSAESLNIREQTALLKQAREEAKK